MRVTRWSVVRCAGEIGAAAEALVALDRTLAAVPHIDVDGVVLERNLHAPRTLSVLAMSPA